jgi:branched-chain amino acid transport system permease protein
VPLYFLVLGVAVVAILTLWIACRGRYGNILAAIQDNEPRASALGHNTSLYLLIVMVLSCMLAGFAGSLYATSIGFVAPDLIGLMLSTEVFVWVAIGGRGTLLGPFIGAFVVLRLQQIISSINYNLWPLLIGAFFVAMVFLFPDGVLSLGRYVAGFFGHHLKSNKREIS